MEDNSFANQCSKEMDSERIHAYIENTFGHNMMAVFDTMFDTIVAIYHDKASIFNRVRSREKPVSSFDNILHMLCEFSNCDHMLRVRAFSNQTQEAKSPL